MLLHKSKSSKTRDHGRMANRRKKMTVPPTTMTVKTMAQMRLSTAAANCQSFFFSSSFRPSSSDGDGNCFMQRHAANFSQKRLFICYAKQRNSNILLQINYRRFIVKTRQSQFSFDLPIVLLLRNVLKSSTKVSLSQHLRSPVIALINVKKTAVYTHC